MSDDQFEDDLLEERIKTKTWDPVLLRRMLLYSRRYWRMVVAGTLLVMLSSFLAVMPPLFIGALVDIVFNTGQSWPGDIVARAVSLLSFWTPDEIRAFAPTEKLALFGLLFLSLRLGTFFIDWGNGYLLNTLGQKVLYDIRMELFTHMHSLSLSFFHRNPVGRLVNRTTNDVGSLEKMFSVALVTVLKDLFMLSGIVLMLVIIDASLAAIVLSVIPFMVLAALIFRKYSRVAYRKWYAAQSRLNSFMAETMSGVRVVQLFHKEKRNDKAYDDIGGEFRHHFLVQRKAWAYFRPAATTLSATGIALVLWFCGSAVFKGAGLSTAAELTAVGAISVGVLVSYLQYAELFFGPIRDLTEKIDVIVGAMTSGERIFTILDEKREIVDRPDAVMPGRFQGGVRFEDVHFEYKPNEPVLRGVTFDVKPGQSVAFVGHTGAGKTTIINLICRFYEVTGGAVLVDGKDVRDFQMAGLRRNIAVVHQDVFLFAGTIFDNIRLGEESITLDQVKSACEYVGANRFIEKLTGGYDAKVEEGGKTFSAGERQLLSFARALVFNPSILILDEATSSIDTHTEEMIQAAMVKLTKGRTSIIIAHRLSTIQRADKIIVMHKGKLAESGNHQQLLAQKGIYFRLYQLQYSALEDTPKEGGAPGGDGHVPIDNTSAGAMRSMAAATRGKAADVAQQVEADRRGSKRTLPVAPQ